VLSQTQTHWPSGILIPSRIVVTCSYPPGVSKEQRVCSFLGLFLSQTHLHNTYDATCLVTRHAAGAVVATTCSSVHTRLSWSLFRSDLNVASTGKTVPEPHHPIGFGPSCIHRLCAVYRSKISVVVPLNPLHARLTPQILAVYALITIHFHVPPRSRLSILSNGKIGHAGYLDSRSQRKL